MTSKLAELKQVVQTLQRQNAELLATNTGKDEFVAIASHQLRTPATAVKQYLAMLLDGYMGTLSAGQELFVQKAYDSNERQLSTINDLLQLAQIDADTFVLHREMFDINGLVAVAVQEQRRLAKYRSQRIILRKKSGQAPMVFADPLRLRMVIDNLIDNAGKYSADHTTIAVSITATSSWITIVISDHGVGIAPKDFSKLFQKFSRIPNPRSIAVGGTGIGLYLARRVIDAHGGSIVVKSKIGAGTTFALRLPLTKKRIP